MMKKPPKDKSNYIAAFDLDKTILDLNSAIRVVIVARRIGLMRNRDFLRAALYSMIYKFDLQNPKHLLAKMTNWLNGIRESDLIDLINNHVSQNLLDRFRPEVLKAIELHRNNGAHLLLLSSAIPYLCKPIADHLSMDEIVCSDMESKNGVLTGKPLRKLVYAEEKEVRMREYCEVHHYPMKTAWYYGDAYTDRFILQSVGNPVCVKPEIKLRQLAKKNNWLVI